MEQTFYTSKCLNASFWLEATVCMQIGGSQEMCISMSSDGRQCVRTVSVGKLPKHWQELLHLIGSLAIQRSILKYIKMRHIFSFLFWNSRSHPLNNNCWLSTQTWTAQVGVTWGSLFSKCYRDFIYSLGTLFCTKRNIMRKYSYK